jgi:hypothetical protein
MVNQQFYSSDNFKEFMKKSLWDFSPDCWNQPPNPEAHELLKQAYKIAFDDPELGIFYGTYLNPSNVERVQQALWKVVGGMPDYETRQQANKLNFDLKEDSSCLTFAWRSTFHLYKLLNSFIKSFYSFLKMFLSQSLSFFHFRNTRVFGISSVFVVRVSKPARRFSTV